MNIRTSCDPTREQRTQGSVLIVVMWVALGLVTVTLYFAHSMYFEFKAAQNNYEGTQARHAVEGALRYAVYLLANQEESGALPDPETYIAERGEVGEATFWFLGRDDLNNTTTLPFFSIADVGFDDDNYCCDYYYFEHAMLGCYCYFLHFFSASY